MRRGRGDLRRTDRWVIFFKNLGFIRYFFDVILDRPLPPETNQAADVPREWGTLWRMTGRVLMNIECQANHTLGFPLRSVGHTPCTGLTAMPLSPMDDELSVKVGGRSRCRGEERRHSSPDIGCICNGSICWRSGMPADILGGIAGVGRIAEGRGTRGAVLH